MVDICEVAAIKLSEEQELKENTNQARNRIIEDEDKMPAIVCSTRRRR
jgi:hypothetical protein